MSDSTVDVFLESAYFDPASIRKTSKREGLQTDASFRFERGCDPNMPPYALKRALQLIVECAGGTVEGDLIDIYPQPIERQRIELDYAYIRSFVGKDIEDSAIECILSGLCYEFVERHEGGSTVLAPSYMIDVCRECDVVGGGDTSHLRVQQYRSAAPYENVGSALAGAGSRGCA